MSTALNGIRVLDLTHMLSGPYAGMMLADLGADVVKVERPGSGERTRTLLASDPRYSRGGVGAYFLTLSRNKRSVGLDLKDPADRERFLALVEVADVVLMNFAVGVAERLGIDHEALARVNPRVITCMITGFGLTGPSRHRTSFDMVAQAVGGGMSITGEPDGRPLRAGLPIGDLGGGVMATIGILAALQHRHSTGVGQLVDISMQDAQLSFLNYMATMHFLSGLTPGPMGNAHPVHVPYDTFQASDGWFIVAVIFDPFWTALLEVVDLPELDTEENRGQPGRERNRAVIMDALRRRFREEPREHWLTAFREVRVPCAPVNDVREALADPHLAERDMVVEVPDGQGGTVRQVGNPVKLTAAGPDTFAAAPGVGEHTEQVFAEWLSR